MFDFSKLYGKIKEVYGTQEKFAAAMGMSRSALSLRLKNSVDWKPKEIVKACELLHIPVVETHLYFFVLKAVKITAKEA